MAARSEAEAFQVFDLGYPGLQPGVVHSKIPVQGYVVKFPLLELSSQFRNVCSLAEENQ